MEHTFLKAGIGPGEELSVAYDADNRRVPWDFCLRPDGGAGFFSTERDLLRYAMFHLNMLGDVRKPVLTPAALETLHRETDPSAPNYRVNPIAGYAMGWGIVEDGKYISFG